ncbi:hypothetical protein TA3x_000592 [Tundrisphaera sp. TA3]|uniref:tetratricopeptide repeat protein n=1 Tax=Tundrisphaera sp. TA3 TaxID=3435775 RepID=UPI003EBDD6EE
MPTTYNGIGTHYYGKKNRSTRTAPCRSCHRVGNLESYDTRLWFVVVFIPIIPLGRKRIIDSCPSCQRHMVADAAKYEQARQLQVSGSLEQYRREASPEAALVAHAQLLAFHEHEQAAELRGQVLDRFPDDARLRAALADHLRQVASFDEMARLNEEALALEPDLPEARAGVASWKMAHGELDEARRLLDFLEEPGAGRQHDLGVLFSLAQSFQEAGRHEEALDLAAALVREAPHVGQLPEFRALVRKAERSVRRAESILPPRRHSLRGLFRAEGSPYSKNQRTLAGLVAALMLAAVGLLVSNEYIRRHRTIRVAYAGVEPVRISVDGSPPVAVGDGGQIVVAEGRHRLQLAGPVEETHEVELGSGFFERWTHSPFWCLNPGGEAVLEQVRVIYASIPQPPESTLIIGRPFVALPHVDYPFSDPPDQLRIKGRNKNKTVEKIAVLRVRGQDVGAFRAVVEGDRASALNFAEGRLRRDPDDDLIDAYANETFRTDRARAEAFFKAGLARRPVSVSWHRAYQNMADHDGGQGRMIAEYDALIAQEPENGALLYLRGRIDPDPDRSLDFYRRASAADPKLAWPVMALGMHDLNLGRWDEALDALQKARGLGMDEPPLLRAIHAARMALGQSGELVGEYRGVLSSNPLDPQVATFLFDALAASGQPGAIEPELAAWLIRLPAPIQGTLGSAIRGFALYQAGRPEDAAGSPGGSAPGLHLVRVQSLAAMGRAAEAAAEPATEKEEDPWTLAAVSLGLALEGDAEGAASWREKAAAILDAATDDNRKAAAILRADAPTPLDRIDRIFFRPGDKALLLAILASRFPDQAAGYREAAARFNVLRLPPYLLVRRAIGAEGPANP